MARKRKSTTTKRRVSASSKKSTRKRVSNSFKPMNNLISGLGYGYFRGQANSFVSNNIASKIPAGEFADEVAFTGLSYLMATKGKKVLGIDLKAIGKAGLQVEGALIGNQISKNMPLNLNLGGVFGTQVTNTSKSVGYNF